MSLEEAIAKNTAALEANTKALLGGKTGGAASTGTTSTKTTSTKITMEEVKAAAIKVMDAKGKPFAKKLIADVGKAKELAAVKPENFAALMAACEKALSSDTGDDEGDEDDNL